MQVSNYVNSVCYASYQRSRRESGFYGGPQPDRSSGISCFAEALRPGSSTDAVSPADCEEEGEFLGITMIPEEGKSVTYGMRAVLPRQADPDHPVVQVISNLGGKKEIYNVEINKVDPQNATQLEMFALLSYTDKRGITDGGTFGSYQQMKTYAMNASQNGYCGNLSGGNVFIYEKFNWSAIIGRMMKDYLEAGIYRQYENCRRLLDYFVPLKKSSSFIREKIK